MVRWHEFAASRPDLARRATELLYEVGVGLAYLSTVRPDGGPRVHPVCPLLTASSLHCFVVPSPKQRDLLRDGRYALHSFPREDDEDAVYLTGTAVLERDEAVRSSLSAQFVAERVRFSVPPPPDAHLLFELLIDRVLVTTTSGHGDPAPRHEVWHPG